MESMNAVNITLDLFSVILTIMIITYLVSRKNDTKGNYYFLWICILNLAFLFGDLSDWCCNGLARPWYPVILHVGQFVYYTVMVPMLYMLIKYVIEYVSSFGKVSPVYLKVVRVLAMFHLVGSVLTPFTGWYYVISEENIYRRGEAVLVASILPVSVYVIVTMIVIQFGKILSLRTMVALLSYAWIPLLGQVIQNFFRGVATINSAITLAILFIFFNIQLDRDLQHEKKEQELAEANIRIMVSQIQPHFLYNTLAVIRGLCENNPKGAKEAIDDFSVFLRANMNSLTEVMPIPFEQELSHVKSYLNLGQRMYEEELKVEYDIQTADFMVPTLSLQPIVENALQKGIRKKDGGGTIFICTEERETEFVIQVVDDGAGFDTDVLEERGHVGIQNVQKRLWMMCRGTLEISSNPGKGTTVSIMLPKGEKGNEISGS